MKKTAFVILGAVIVSAAVGGLAGWSINRYSDGRSADAMYYAAAGDGDVAVRDTMPKAGTHFTAYQADQYPDLTYAAENAVKAVRMILSSTFSESLTVTANPRRASSVPAVRA